MLPSFVMTDESSYEISLCYCLGLGHKKSSFLNGGVQFFVVFVS